MPGIAAILSLDGAPAPHDRLLRLRAAAPHRGVAVPVSLGACCIWFDGRIDNRGDLAAAFGWRGPEGRPDAEFAAHAFARWGADAPSRLLGDFALLAFDTRTRSALLARDPIGLRPLHFARAGPLLFVASELAQILALPGVDRTPDETAIAELLAFRPSNDQRTLYRAIARVPPAHVVRADASGSAATRYWSAEPRPTAVRMSDEAHALACREHLETAIRARMGDRGRTAVFFSGGVDSSAVLSIACHVARTGKLPLSPLALSLEYEARPESDESQYRDAVAVRCGVTPVVVRPDPAVGGFAQQQARARGALPDMPADAAFRPLQRAALAHRAARAMTGAGGDWLFGGSPLAYADLLRNGRVAAALRRYRLDRRTADSGWSLGSLATAGVWPLLPAPIRRSMRPAARALAGVRPPAWLRLRVADRPLAARIPRKASVACAEITACLDNGWIPLTLELYEQTCAELGFEVAHPLLDRRVVEFALSLPADQRTDGLQTRVVLRRAAADLLPASLVARTSKADFGHVIVSALEAAGGRSLFARLTIAERGWVDGPGVLALYDRVLGGPRVREERGATLPILWTIAAVELWARALA